MTTNSDDSINSPFNDDPSYEISPHQDKSNSKLPKPLLRCVVCGDTAFGHNFDAISCESCKAFFRRTALRPPGKLKCRSNGFCEITVETRKRCKKCRLDKCFKMGMRKEWIMTEAEKKNKRSQIEENRRRKQKHKDDQDSSSIRKKHVTLTTETASPSNSGDLQSLTASDWSRIHQVQFAYSESIALNKVIGVPCFPASQPIHSTVELIRIPTYLASIRLITFLKKIPEFNLFDPEDRVTLVKYNLLAVVFMHVVLIYDPKSNSYHEHGTEDPIFQGTDWIEILGEEFYQDITNVATQLIHTMDNDRVIIKTFLLLILFTKGFCGYDISHEPTLKNPLLVFETQNSYLESLYKHCVHQHGLQKTLTIFTSLPGHLLSVQRLAIHLKDFVHDHVDVSQISPLMQSLLQLSDSVSPE